MRTSPGLAASDAHSSRNGRIAIVLAATAWSTAGLAQRSLAATAATQVAGRALFAFLALLVAVLVAERRGTIVALRSLGRDGAALAFFLAVSSGTFFLALTYTTVANVLFLQAAAPMTAALLGWLVLREPVDGRTWLAMALAALGIIVMVVASSTPAS